MPLGYTILRPTGARWIVDRQNKDCFGCSSTVHPRLSNGSQHSLFGGPHDRHAPFRLLPGLPAGSLTGTRKSDGLRLTLAFSLAPADFRPTNGKSVSVQGVIIEGRLGFLNPRAWKIMSGRATFERAEMKPDAAVRGEVKLNIVKMVRGKSTRLEAK